MNYTLQIRDRKAYAVASYTLQDEPVLRSMYFELDVATDDPRIAEGMTLRHTIGSPVFDTDVRTVSGQRLCIRFRSQKREFAFAEETPLPCPNVRKGVETRYRYGEWQKYSKREGWIAA